MLKIDKLNVYYGESHIPPDPWTIPDSGLRRPLPPSPRARSCATRAHAPVCVRLRYWGLYDRYPLSPSVAWAARKTESLPAPAADAIPHTAPAQGVAKCQQPDNHITDQGNGTRFVTRWEQRRYTCASSEATRRRSRWGIVTPPIWGFIVDSVWLEPDRLERIGDSSPNTLSSCGVVRLSGVRSHFREPPVEQCPPSDGRPTPFGRPLCHG